MHRHESKDLRGTKSWVGRLWRVDLYVSVCLHEHRTYLVVLSPSLSSDALSHVFEMFLQDRRTRAPISTVLSMRPAGSLRCRTVLADSVEDCADGTVTQLLRNVRRGFLDWPSDFWADLHPLAVGSQLLDLRAIRAARHRGKLAKGGRVLPLPLRRLAAAAGSSSRLASSSVRWNYGRPDSGMRRASKCAIL